jgi:hypothetical protein
VCTTTTKKCESKTWCEKEKRRKENIIYSTEYQFAMYIFGSKKEAIDEDFCISAIWKIIQIRCSFCLRSTS